jgi:hypothetical protein
MYFIDFVYDVLLYQSFQILCHIFPSFSFSLDHSLKVTRSQLLFLISYIFFGAYNINLFAFYIDTKLGSKFSVFKKTNWLFLQILNNYFLTDKKSYLYCISDFHIDMIPL